MGLLDYASLYDRFGGDNSSAYPLDPSAKRKLFKQGLLEFAAAMSRPNGGNFANSLATGLLAAKRGGQEGAAQYVNDAYRGDIMARTRAQMDANTRLEQAKAAVLGPDGQLDEAKFRQYAVMDPQGAKALRDAIAPRMEYDIQNIDGQLYYVPKDPQVAPPQSAPQAPAPSVLNAAVEQQESGGNPFAVSPAGARGPMQTMPGTLRDPGYGVAPAKDGSVDEQRRVGQDYLAALTAKYGLDGGLAAYNWGPGNWERALAANGGNVQSALMSAPKETRDYVPSVKRRLGQFGNMTASMGDTAPAGAFPVPGVPRGKGKASTVQTRAQELADMQAQGIKITQDMRDQYLMTGKMPNTEDDPSSPLSDAAIDNAATRYNVTGMMPPLGMGKAAAEQRSRILTRAAELANGQTAEDLATQPLTYKNSQAVVKGLQQSSAAMSRATEALHSNAELLVKASERVLGGSWTGSRPENEARLAYGRMTNDPDVAAYDQYVQTVANEYAKIIGGAPGSNAAATEGARADAERAIHKAMSPAALRATIDSLYKEAENFRKANEEQLEKLRASLVPGKKPASDVSGMSDADLLKALGQ